MKPICLLIALSSLCCVYVDPPAVDYTAGGVISKQAFRYGYYEASLKLHKGRGWHTSFWMMRSGSPAGFDDRYQAVAVCEQHSSDHNADSPTGPFTRQLRTISFAPDGRPAALLGAADETASRTHSFNIQIPLQEP